MSDETIFALSTASARAALAVVRLSGPACDSALVALGITRLPPPRMAGLRALAAPQNGALLEEAVVLRFQAPYSFTGLAGIARGRGRRIYPPCRAQWQNGFDRG